MVTDARSLSLSWRLRSPLQGRSYCEGHSLPDWLKEVRSLRGSVLFDNGKQPPAASPEVPKRKDTPVRENRVISLEKRAEDGEKPFFEQLLQEGARKLLQAAIENEIIEYIQFHQDRRDEDGQRLVVRNGHLPEREIVSGIGPIKVRQPRVRSI